MDHIRTRFSVVFILITLHHQETFCASINGSIPLATNTLKSNVNPLNHSTTTESSNLNGYQETSSSIISIDTVFYKSYHNASFIQEEQSNLQHFNPSTTDKSLISNATNVTNGNNMPLETGQIAASSKESITIYILSFILVTTFGVFVYILCHKYSDGTEEQMERYLETRRNISLNFEKIQNNLKRLEIWLSSKTELAEGSAQNESGQSMSTTSCSSD